MLNLGSLLSLGFNVGWANKRINTSNLIFPASGMGNFLMFIKPVRHLYWTTNNISYLDIQAGMNYAYFPNENMYLNIGFSSLLISIVPGNHSLMHNRELITGYQYGILLLSMEALN